jgi:hypothetical protein
MENIKINPEIEKDYSSDEDNPASLIETSENEINSLETSNDYLLVGIFGNGSGFLKSSLYTDMKSNTNSLKIKFQVRASKDRNKAKKVCAELFQFTNNGTNHLVLHTKDNFSDQSYQYVLDFFKNKGIKYKRVVVFDSCHISGTVGLENKSHLFCLKNTMQNRSNQLIRVKNLPMPNTINNFAAYLLTYHEVIDIPCVAFLAVTDLYEVCLDSVKNFNETTISYVFLRDKLSDGFFTQNQITSSSIHLLFKEFNAFKNLVYS